MQQLPEIEPNPISEPVNVTKLPNKGLNLSVKPDETQRAALAAFNGLSSIEDFVAKLTLTRWQRDGIQIKGEIKAALTQPCALTLVPVSQELQTEIDAVFVPEGSRLAKTPQQGEAGEILVDPEGDDAPEPFVLPWLDVGDVVQEFFALAIDPWPRAPGAEQPMVAKDDAAALVDERPNPFAALAKLKDKL